MIAAGAVAGAGHAAGAAVAAPGVAVALAFAVLSLLPFVFMSTTAFVKISTVLQIVKGAIGAPDVPSGTIVLALSFALTLLAMAPVGQAIATRAAPLLAGPLPDDPVALVREGVAAVREPMRGFLARNASPKETARFLRLARDARSAQAAPAPIPGAHPPDGNEVVAEDDLVVVAPAFVVTELGEAFAVGFLLYLPFLVLDLVVANVVAVLGLQGLNPSYVSLPFKLLLFVAIDGWGLLAQSLVSGYR